MGLQGYFLGKAVASCLLGKGLSYSYLGLPWTASECFQGLFIVSKVLLQGNQISFLLALVAIVKPIFPRVNVEMEFSVCAKRAFPKYNLSALPLDPEALF